MEVVLSIHLLSRLNFHISHSFPTLQRNQFKQLLTQGRTIVPMPRLHFSSSSPLSTSHGVQDFSGFHKQPAGSRSSMIQVELFGKTAFVPRLPIAPLSAQTLAPAVPVIEELPVVVESSKVAPVIEEAAPSEKIGLPPVAVAIQPPTVKATVKQKAHVRRDSVMPSLKLAKKQDDAHGSAFVIAQSHRVLSPMNAKLLEKSQVSAMLQWAASVVKAEVNKAEKVEEQYQKGLAWEKNAVAPTVITPDSGPSSFDAIADMYGFIPTAT